MSTLPRGDGVVDEVDRIRGARVLGEPVVVEIELPGLGIDDHVFEDGPEPARGRVDLRLGLRRQLDRLRVAAAFEVEDAAVAPAVLVVADQHPLRIARQRRLAGARQPEEQRRVARGPEVGRAVHRQHAPQRQQVVEDAEDRFLHLAGVAGAADQDELLGEVHGDDGLAPGAVPGRIGAEARDVDDRELRHVRRPPGSTMNRLRANRLCQAYSLITRTGSRY